MNEAIDYSTVKWVKQELDATLKQARQALEAHVENPDDESQLRFCAVHLHQVHGTLTMVELYGAALLAEEMEQVVEALLAGNVSQKQEAYELVMRAILQLPDYLERLVAGGRDLPLVLLPLLNDLRAIRGQKLLSENALFSPDLNLPLPDAARLACSGEDLLAVVRKQRHSYQLALLGWFRGKDVETNLGRLGDALKQMQAVCRQDAAQRLWWIAGGMVAALRAGWLETSMSTKLLLGQVDRQIKRMLDEGEDALVSRPPADLLKNLLFYVARSKDGGEPISLIRQSYRLSTLLPDSMELEQAQDSLSGHNADLMRTVSVAIKEDLARVKDALDLFLRGGRKTTADLQPAADTLARVGDTLGMLGLGALRKVAQTQSQTASDLVAGRRAPEEAVLMDIASALLYVESSLEGLVRGESPEPEPVEAGKSAGMTLPEAEFNQVRGVVADEAIRDISQAKDAILAFMENTSDSTVLEKVPQLFYQIKGGLLLLNEQRAAELIDAVCDYIAERMLARREQPADSALDDLADAISSVEYYLESLREGRVFGNTILDVAAKSIERLSGVVVSAQPTQAMPEPTAEEMLGEASDTVEFEAAEEITFETVDLPIAEADAFALADAEIQVEDLGTLAEPITVAEDLPSQDDADMEAIDLSGGFPGCLRGGLRRRSGRIRFGGTDGGRSPCRGTVHARAGRTRSCRHRSRTTCISRIQRAARRYRCRDPRDLHRGVRGRTHQHQRVPAALAGQRRGPRRAGRYAPFLPHPQGQWPSGRCLAHGRIRLGL
jgi:chemosensory pili system protein ChpA (sensor histidine kinase/response regulator)